MTAEMTLITGASSGIGLHLAREFAKHGHPLVLVAPDERELQTLAQGLQSEFGVDVDVIAQDLEQPDAVEAIGAHLEAAGIQIEIVVNNAGHGFRGKSWEIPLEQDISMVRLNIEAPLRLTKHFLPKMVAANQGRILNTASIAGFEPGPLLNVYHSTKAFILSWSEALAIELEDTDVTVTALCPGATDTDFFPKADMEAVKGFQKGPLAAPQDVAEAGYKAVMAGELFVVPGAMNKMMVAALRILPVGTQAKMNESMYEDVPPEDQKRKRGDMEIKAALKEDSKGSVLTPSG